MVLYMKVSGCLFSRLRNSKQAKMTYPDGSVYQGEWYDKECYREGKMTYPDGSVYEGGIFDKSRRDHETLTFRGKLSDLSRQGFGKMTYPDGNLRYEGIWINDAPTTNKPTKGAKCV